MLNYPFVFGIIVGLLMSLVLLLIEIFFKKGEKTIINRVDDTVQGVKNRRQVTIIQGLDPVQQTQSDIIAENDAKNVDTRLEEL